MKKSLSPAAQKRITILLFIVLGVIALVFGISTLTRISKYEPVEALITRIDTEYDQTENEYRYETYVKYTVDGRTYEGPLGFHKDGYEEGKTIDIRYDPANPEQVEGAGLGVAIYLIVLGPILLAAGVIMFLRGKV